MPERPFAVLAFDFGLQRIGLASGDTLTRTPSPRGAIGVTHRGPDWDLIARAVNDAEPGLLVVGAPYNEDGSASEMTARARAFAAELGHRFRLPVAQVDERYSSLEASTALKSQRSRGLRRRHVRREDVDGTAAAVILQRWFSGEGNAG